MLRPSLASLAAVLLLAAPAFCDEAATAQRFAAAKASEPELVAFLKGMPKGADLHNHVWGAIYAETFLDLAAKGGWHINPETLAFSTRPALGYVPAKELLAGGPLSARFLEALSMRGDYPAVRSGHDHFFGTFRLFAPLVGALGPDAMLAEVVGRARAQNVLYMELMAEVNSDAAIDELLKDPAPADDLEKALAAAQKKFPALLADAKAYLDERDRKAAGLLGIEAPLTGLDSPIPVRYIFTVPRTAPDAKFFALMAAGMAVAQDEPRVAAVNILAPEDAPSSRQNFESQMRVIDFLWSRLGRPNMTLHAGELTLEYSPVEPMRSRIRKTVELGHARRIGHGVSVAWEDDLPGLLREMKDRRVAVEINLTSNAGILKVTPERHPFKLYRAAGIPLTLNTDDEGVNRSNLTMEYVKAARAFDLSYADLKDLSRNGLEYSFLPGESLYEAGDYARPQADLAGLRDPAWQPDAKARALMARSQKLALQVRLERAFVEFQK